MLIFIQFPITDFRSFLPHATGRLHVPIWPSPIPYKEFMRNFGEIRRRGKGGMQGWVGENQICGASHAIKFTEPLHIQSKNDSFDLKCIGRHFYFDGQAVGKLEAVLITIPKFLHLSRGLSMEFLNQLVEKSVKIPITTTNGNGTRAKIIEAGKYVGNSYLISTTEKNALDAIDLKKWVKNGTPVVVLESSAKEDINPPSGAIKISLPYSDASIYHWWTMKDISTWLINRDTDEKEVKEHCRNIRILLMRLHAEYQSFYLMLKFIHKKMTPSDEYCDLTDSLQNYLNSATKRIFRFNKSSELYIEPEAIGKIVRSSYEKVNPGERHQLIQSLKLLNLRPQILYKILRGCGLSDWEIEMLMPHNPELSNDERNDVLCKKDDLQAGQAIQVSPLFISYSHADNVFVNKLGNFLQNNGIRSWRDIHDMKAGRMEKQIDRAIRQNPTVLLVLSEHSLSSDWVEHEVLTARQLEKDIERDVLCPVALDDSWKRSRWPRRIMEQIQEYNILDFSEWEDDVKFEGMFRKLIDGLELFYKG